MIAVREGLEKTTFANQLTSIHTAARYGVTADPAAMAWLGSLADDVYAKIAATGIVAPRKTITAHAFFQRFDNVAENVHTRRNDQQALRAALRFIPEGKLLSDLSREDAENLRTNLVASCGRATWARHLKRIRCWLHIAVKEKLIDENPMVGIKCPVSDNPERKRFIDRETFERVLAVTVNPYWRLILALSRYGGLRIPSEALNLRWSDIDWKAQTIRIVAHKTRERRIPLFRELRPFLEAMPRGGSDHVIDRCRGAATNWRAQIIPLVAKAGIELWPKLFHNLRASRETELCEQFSVNVACEWIGNSAGVALTHYLTVRPDDFAKAVA